MLLDQRKPEQALVPLRSALAIVEKSRSADDPDAARAAYNLALAEAAAGDLPVARSLAARAAFVAERALGSRHPVTRQMKRTELQLRGLPDNEKPRPQPADAGQAAVAALPDSSAAAPSASAAPSIREQADGRSTAKVGQSFAVQLMALRDESSVERAWTELHDRYKRLQGTTRLPTVPVEVAGKGRFYRLLVGPYATRADAQSLCSGLKRDGGECRVVIQN